MDSAMRVVFAIPIVVAAAISAVADEMYVRRTGTNAMETVWLDESGLWERMSGGHGRSRRS